MAQDKYARLVGEPLTLHATRGPLQPCYNCGSTFGQVREGVRSHKAAVACSTCGTHLGWLGDHHLSALVAGSKRAPIIEEDEGEAA